MTLSKRNLWGAVAAVALTQTLFLAWMVWDRVNLLRTGREVVMQVVPVDPRDIFRGDYVVLGYNLSPVTFTATKEEADASSLRLGGSVFVTIAPDIANTWKIVGVTTGYPSTVEAGAIVLKARIERVDPGATPEARVLQVRYGIESYFVPEGEGLKLEQLVRDKKIEAVIAVDEDGDAAIKALAVEGKRISEQPLL
jgi:uncharacterized membrane-anchored protein